MDIGPTQAMLDRLRALLTCAVAAASDVAAADAAWEKPAAHSTARSELTAEEARRPEPFTGSWPWCGALLNARWAMGMMIEEAKSLSPLLAPDVTSYAADVLCRAVMESASVAWWLLDPDIDAQRRTARWLVHRLHAAREAAKLVDSLSLGTGEDRSGYGESVTEVHEAIKGLGWTCNDKEPSVTYGTDKEPWLRYTPRIETLACKIWPQAGLPYRILSAVAHAELPGLIRNLAPPQPGSTWPRPAPGPDAALWLWQDSYLVLGALVLTAGRAASFLGLDDQAVILDALTGYLNRALPALRPVVG